MKVLVCGGRDNWSFSYLCQILDSLEITEIIEGGALGADSLAYAYALINDIPCTTVNADWNKYKKAAGFIRNKKMILMNPDLVVALAGGSGTKMMKQITIEAGVDLIV